MADRVELMRRALALAKRAAKRGEVPVGCVIAKDGVIVGEGYNTRETKKTAVGHAEIRALEKACKTLGGWRLSGCEMFVTLEPCPMCAGAILNARIDRVYASLRDPKAGCFGSVADLNALPFNHKAPVEFGLLEEESREILQRFFRALREKK